MDLAKNHSVYRLESIPAPPDTCSEGAKLEWQTLAVTIFELQTARPADLRTLELLCEIMADINVLQETIRSDGIMIEGGSGGYKAHPGQKALETARRQAHRLLDQFGLVPGSKARPAPKFNAHDHNLRFGE